MMFFSDTVSLYILVACNAVLAGAIALAFVRNERRMHRFERFWNSPTGAALAEQQPAQKPQPPTRPQGTRHLERRVAELQKTVGTLASSQRRKTAVPEPRWPIENAVRMARHGASIDELIRSCGLNIGEAQLMRKLHGKVRGAASVN